MARLSNPAPKGWQSRGWGSNHRGIDYGFYNANPEGTKDVVASLGGTVESVYGGGGNNSNWGNRVIIDHGHGVKTTYNHLRTGTIAVSDGQRVDTGTYIGKMGSTGLSSGPHLHFELYVNGDRIDPGPYFSNDLPNIPAGSFAGGIALEATQRRANSTARRRSQPTTQSEHVGGGSTDIVKGDVGNFVGFAHGENVEGNDIWFQGTSGDWFWSGGFEGGANVSALPDITPKPAAPALDPSQRVAIATCRRRSQPTAQSDHVDGGSTDLEKGAVANFTGWTRGENVEGNDVWFQGTSGDWFWSGGFDGGANTSGLAEVAFSAKPVSPEAPAAPAAPTQLDSATPWKNQTPDSPLAKWVGSPNYGYRPAKPKDHITVHWMAGTLSGTDALFQKPGEVVNGKGTSQATNYGVGLTEIHQYVKETEYVHSDGNAESNASTISIEHEGGYRKNGQVVPVSTQTLDLSAKLMADIARRHGWKTLEWKVNVFPHNHYVATACPGTGQPGGLDHVYLLEKANALLNPAPEPEPEPEPEPKPEEENVDSLIGKINELLAKLASLLKR